MKLFKNLSTYFLFERISEQKDVQKAKLLHRRQDVQRDVQIDVRFDVQIEAQLDVQIDERQDGYLFKSAQ